MLKKYKLSFLIVVCFIIMENVVTVLADEFSNHYDIFHSTHAEVLISSKIGYENGCYSYHLKYPSAADGKAKSNLILYENGVEIGPAHSSHSQIKAKGKGKYSHWKSDYLYFSTSDNSNPRTNGRSYEAVTYHDTIIHEELVVNDFHKYQITVKGIKNPFNRYIKIENAGETDLINPKVISDGGLDMFSVKSIVKGLISASMTDKEKAVTLWEFVRDNRYNWYPAERPDVECDPIKLFNVYGYEFCSAAAESLEILWEEAGLTARCWDLQDKHVVAEVFYDYGWHMFDPHYEIFYLKRDNKTVASVEDLENDPDLILRELKKPVRCKADWLAELYAAKNKHKEEYTYRVKHTMNITLRPDEFLTRYWEIGSKYHDNCYHKEPPVYANGNIVYVPDLTKVSCIKGVYERLNVKFFVEDRKRPYIHADNPGEIAYVIYKVKSPYTVVGSNVGGSFSGICKMYISFNCKDWIKIWENDKPGKIKHYENIDLIVNNPTGGNYPTKDWNPELNEKYLYFVKYEFISNGNDNSGLDEISLDTDIQVAPKSLPPLNLGVNNICFSDDGNYNDVKSIYKSGKVKITYAWEEN